MPICTRLSTPIPRNYLHSEQLNSIADPLAREAYLRAKLACDNLGRLPANPATLGGILFPANPPQRKHMAEIISLWDKAGLVFHYTAGMSSYVEIADSGETQKLIGHMSEKSEFPGPPKDLIAEWQKKFCREWKSVARKSSRKTASSNGVHTGTNPVDTRSNGVSLCSAVQCSAVKGKKRLGANAPARSPRNEFANRKVGEVADPRYNVVVDFYFAEFTKRDSGVNPTFDDSDGKAVKKLLKQQAGVAPEVLVSWLRNAFDSEREFPLQKGFRLREFCSHATKYTKCPLTKKTDTVPRVSEFNSSSRPADKYEPAIIR